jgi:hypothetical protein
MAQAWIVALVVLLAAGYSVWYVLPNTLRQHLGRIHTSLGPSKPCANCSNCGGCASGKSTTALPLVAEQAIKFYPPKRS